MAMGLEETVHLGEAIRDAFVKNMAGRELVYADPPVPEADRENPAAYSHTTLYKVAEAVGISVAYEVVKFIKENAEVNDGVIS